MGMRARCAVALAAAGLVGAAGLFPAAAAALSPAAAAAPSPAEPAAAAGPPAFAPYYYAGWGSPPDPATVMSATGVTGMTLGFLLDGGGCDPKWDGSRPLRGGQDEKAIAAIRDSGGDVVASFGGASGSKLEARCSDAGSLAAAYRKAIDAHGLRAIDIDLEGDAARDPQVRQRTVDALKQVTSAKPDLKVGITIATAQAGPDGALIEEAAKAHLEPDTWSIMAFDFGGSGQSMGELVKRAAEGLKATVAKAYGYDDATAYRHGGITAMNGITDNEERVTPQDFSAIRGYAEEHHLGRLAFWSVNRDRRCAAAAADSCSGVDQQDWEFTKSLAGYNG